MTIWNAIVLGIVQGIAEFLPVSSSGHLSIIENLFGMATAEGDRLFFDVLLHLGTVASIIIVYWTDIKRMVLEVLGLVNVGPMANGQKKYYKAARLFIMIVLGTLPLLLIFPIKDQLESLYYSSAFVGFALILTGAVLYTCDHMAEGQKTAGNMGILDAFIIGVCQAVAVIPGLSRSGLTITAGTATGLKRSFAVKYSFLLSIPAVLGANLLSFVDAVSEGIILKEVPAYLIGTAVAMVIGIIALSLLKYIARKGKFGGFAYYCWTVGALTIILSLIF